MEVFEYFPVWDKLTSEQQNTLSRSALRRSVKAGSLIHGGEKSALASFLCLPAGSEPIFSRKTDAKSRFIAWLRGISACFQHPV